MMFATKNLKVRCDVARQPLWRYVKVRHHSCDDTWSSATNLNFFLLFVSISSGTPHVVTAMVAVFDVPPQGLSRNIKYGSSFSDGKSRGATGGLNSSEAWFIDFL
jgi:hypothetical protein